VSPRSTVSPSLLITFFREIIGKRTLPREPEPDLVMDDAKQVEAYLEAGRIDGVMAAAYLFHSAHISQVIQKCKFVVDLGCGPATQLCQIARFNPSIQFLGLDLSPVMLEKAKRQAEHLKLDNVKFATDDMTRIAEIPDHSVDGVISTMALHHLPDLAAFHACFRQISRILKPGGAVYLTDFGRLKSLKSVIYFAYMNRHNQPHLFSLDYERSLRAAFLHEDFLKAVAKELPAHVEVFSTFKVPFLVIVKSVSYPLPDSVRKQVLEFYQQMPSRYRHELNNLRIFFRFGGLTEDPFRIDRRFLTF